MIYILSDTPIQAGITVGPRAIGPYRLATELRNFGYEVEVIDFMSTWSVTEILRYIDSGPTPLWVGFSSTFSWPTRDRSDENVSHYWDKLTRFNSTDEEFLWSELKKRSRILLGGARADRLKYIYDADYVVTGYADLAIVAISDYLSGKTNQLNFLEEKIKNIKNNLVYHIRTINCQEHYPVTDVSNISTEFHETDFVQIGEPLPLEIARGCIFKCSFCAFPLNGKSKNDYIRSEQQIKNDIKTYQEKYQSYNYYFLDDTFNDNIEKMLIIKNVQENSQPFKFWSFGRLDLLGAKPEMMNLVSEIGWKSLNLGIETFNKEAGKKIGKGQSEIKTKEALTDLRKINPTSEIIIELIVGIPGETEESILSTVEWLEKNSNLWDSVRIKELSIPKKQYHTWVSSMSESPEKYGIIFIDKNPKETFHYWKHETMDRTSAIKLANEMVERISKLKNNYNVFYTMAPLEGSIFKNKKVAYIDYSRNLAKTYKKLKFESRNLSL